MHSDHCIGWPKYPMLYTVNFGVRVHRGKGWGVFFLVEISVLEPLHSCTIVGMFLFFLCSLILLGLRLVLNPLRIWVIWGRASHYWMKGKGEGDIFTLSQSQLSSELETEQLLTWRS